MYRHHEDPPTPYHLQGNRTTERFNCTLMNMLLPDVWQASQAPCQLDLWALDH